MFRLIAMSTLALFAMCGHAHARKFSFDDEMFSAFFRGTYSPAAFGADPFGYSSGTGTKFSDDYNHTLSGEIGFVIGLGGYANLRLGLEALSARTAELVGRDSGGTKLMDLKSTMLVINPTASIEYNVMNQPTSRLFAFGGFGVGELKLDNKYTFTSAGSAAFGGLEDYTENSKAREFSYVAGVGYEHLFVDNVTAMFELGYRYFPINQLKYETNETVIRGTGSANVTKGQTVLNDDGSQRSFDMSGVYAGISFRFYIPVF